MARLVFENIRYISYEGDEGEVMICVSHSGSLNLYDEESNRILTK